MPKLSRVNNHQMIGFPLNLLRELRTDHAGETGAVMIYKGILAITRDKPLQEFAHHHLETEQRHLLLIEDIVTPRWRSKLLPLWRIAGWLTGAIPACFGSRAVYATIQAVETFVDKHYAMQVEMIDALLLNTVETPLIEKASLQGLRDLLVECQLDEVHHRDDAQGRWSGQANIILRVWIEIVGNGSRNAVGICRYF